MPRTVTKSVTTRKPIPSRLTVSLPKGPLDVKTTRALCQILAQASLNAAYVDWKESKGNPVHLLEGFVTAGGAGLPMPPWIVQELTKAFRQILESKDKDLSLARVCGPKRGRGKPTHWTARDRSEKVARLTWLIDSLKKKGLPVSPTRDGNSAAEIVVASLAQENDDTYTPESLADEYLRIWQKSRTRLSR